MSYNDSIVRQASSSQEGCDDRQTAFLQWFHRHGGSLNAQCRFADFAELGTGMVAASAIESDELLFSIPRHMLLNVRNSQMPGLCRGFDAQQAASSTMPTWDNVNVGWFGLMTTMMWEHARSSTDAGAAIEDYLRSNKIWAQHAETVNGANDASEARAAGHAYTSITWATYFDILPTHFDTPMFWNDVDLAELHGTSIPDKIGKQEATSAYEDTIRPYILARLPIFLGTVAETDAADALMHRYYSLEQFHIMGSRILSRSFHVKGGEGVGEGLMDGVQGGGREVDGSDEEGDSDDDEDGSDEGAEEIEDVSMVPMADMLNARYGHDNARLFYRAHTLEMRATRRIEAGEQVWNTYGEPPSSDLLRRYGYVDLGNPADVVELGLEDLLAGRMAMSASLSSSSKRQDAFMQRLAWACALGMDEVSPLTYPFAPASTPPYRAPSLADMPKSEVRAAALNLPDDLLVLARVLCLSDEAFAKAQAKERLPSPRVDAVEQHDDDDAGALGVAQLLLHAVEARSRIYATTLEQDEALLFADNGNAAARLSLNKRNAVVIRVSEKRILADTQTVLRSVIEAVQQKRKSDQRATAGSSKKARRA